MTRLFLLSYITLLIASCGNSQTQDNEKLLTATLFQEKIKTTSLAQVLDVRTPQEFEKGHLANAINIDWNGDNFISTAQQLDKKKPLFVYCLGGGRSAAAVEALQKDGFQNIYELKGGMMAWRAANLPEAGNNTNTTSSLEKLSISQYETIISDSSKLVLVDFYADWCIPCKKMEPYLKKFSEEMKGTLQLVRIDADANTDLCKALSIEELPVLKLYKNNQLVWEHTGFIEEKQVRIQLAKAELP